MIGLLDLAQLMLPRRAAPLSLRRVHTLERREGEGGGGGGHALVGTRETSKAAFAVLYKRLTPKLIVYEALSY
jgi:hypothetical protein